MAKPLKEQRERLGKELNEIAKITRIKSSYLKAIEEEDFAKLPVEVYTKGYIRVYAKFLGVSLDVAIAPYETYLDEIKGVKDKEAGKSLLQEKPLESHLTKEVSEVPAPSLERREPGKPIVKDFSKAFSQKIAWWAVSLVLIVAVAYFLIPKGKETSTIQQKIEPEAQYKIPEITAPQPMQDVSQGKGVQSTAPAVPTIPPVAQERAEDKTKPVQGAKKKHNLDITATDKAWIQIIIDGADKKEMLLNAGEKVNYEASQSINLLIGNAAGVKLKFNGKEFGSLGDKGQVVTLSFPAAASTPPTPQPSNSSNP